VEPQIVKSVLPVKVPEPSPEKPKDEKPKKPKPEMKDAIT
jgi:hypothetical protein